MPDDSLTADLSRLEEIVQRLDRDDLDLDAALTLFEEGIAKLKSAQARLSEAEGRVQRVLEDAAGVLRLTKFDA